MLGRVNNEYGGDASATLHSDQAIWEAIVSDAVALRRTLHQQPELTWQERDTAALIRSRLDDAGIAWRPCAEHGACATLAPEADGEAIALRADMDALPVEEASGSAFASERSGCMHACGHDGHMAVLWATAVWLKRHEAALPGPVTLLFQPAEEGGHGARAMIEDGALDGIDTIFGWHNWPEIPFGQAVCPDGAVMAGNGTFHIDLQGRGGHTGQPDACRDPVLAAAAVTLNLQQIVSRRLPPQSPAVVSVASIDGVSAPTITPARVRVEGSIRVVNHEDRANINDLIIQITRGTAAAYGVKADVEIRPRYEATINHAVAAARYREALAAELGDDWCMKTLPQPVMASEDFHYYLTENKDRVSVPGAFALIGNGGAAEYNHACHSPHYGFNDRLLPLVVRLYARLVGAPLPPKDSQTHTQTHIPGENNQCATSS